MEVREKIRSYFSGPERAKHLFKTGVLAGAVGFAALSGIFGVSDLAHSAVLNRKAANAALAGDSHHATDLARKGRQADNAGDRWLKALDLELAGGLGYLIIARGLIPSNERYVVEGTAQLGADQPGVPQGPAPLTPEQGPPPSVLAIHPKL